ncbi:MAG: hypothetical protein NVS3B12_11610 [Acidimicrobiales bacterium]
MSRLRPIGAGLVAGGVALLGLWAPGAGAAVAIPPVSPAAPRPSSAAPGATPAAAPTDATPSGVVSGWWHQLNQAPVPLPLVAPANPSTPPDGIEVSSNATGVVSIGAVRFSNVPDGSDSELDLRLAGGTATSTSGDLVVHACPTTNAWKPVQNGKWADRAMYTEASCVTGKPSADTKSVHFSLPSSLMKPGTVDVAIEAMSAAPVTLSFAHPVPSDLVLSAVSPPTPTPAPAATVDAPTNAPAPVETAPADTSLSAPSTDASTSAGPGLSRPSSEPVAPPTATPAQQLASAPAQRTLSPASALLPPPFQDSRSTRILAVALLIGIGLALFWFGGETVRAPRLIGNLGGRMGIGSAPAVAPKPMRGIGRFARPRDGSLRAQH